jgi:hypothetical protein
MVSKTKSIPKCGQKIPWQGKKDTEKIKGREIVQVSNYLIIVKLRRNTGTGMKNA